MSVRIRPVDRADLLAVLRIERASFPTPWPHEAFERFLDAPGFLVAVDEGGEDATGGPVVGYVVADLVESYGRSLGHVKNLAVHPDRREQGIGAALLSRALLATSEAAAVKLEVRASNDAAMRLYRRFGFERLREVEGYYDDGEDAVVMVRESA